MAAGRPALPIPTDALTTNQVLFSGPCVLHGWALCNKSASSGDFELFDGLDGTGTPLAFLHLVSVANSSIWMGGAGVYCAIGLYLTIGATPLRGAVFYTPLDDQQLDIYPDLTDTAKAMTGYGTRG